MSGYGVLVVPLSWALGRWDRKAGKTLWAFGPIRFIRSKNLPNWKGV